MQGHPKAPPVYTTRSGIPVKASYGPDDVPAEHRALMGGLPGDAPYHRGCFPQGYRSKPWRIFQLSGFGKPEDENERIKFLLKNGETGFLMEHDRNTADHLYNVDHPDVVARREDVGLTGAVMQSIRETAICMDGLPIESTYGHAGGAVVQHAPFALAAYWSVAKRRGLPLAQLGGTGQSDFFLTYLGCVTKQQVPTAAGLRLNADIIEFCGEHLPKWVPVSIAGYNGGDTGLNAWQELGAVMANAIEYLDEVKRRTDGKALAVQLQDPRVPTELFDMVVPPEHDELEGANVVPIIGSPNIITPERLAEAGARWQSFFQSYPSPRVAVLIGGKSKAHRFEPADAQLLADQLRALSHQGYSLFVTASRRTGEAQMKILQESLTAGTTYLWDGTGDNPYLGMLALADAILVTSDSTNMMVEAAGTGKPVHIVQLMCTNPKFGNLIERLSKLGIARRFDGSIAHWTYEPLHETARVASIIRRKLGSS